VRTCRLAEGDGYLARQRMGEADWLVRKLVVYYAWNRPGEVGAPLEVIENRFPTLFENRRMLYPRFEAFSDPARFDQSIGGFLDRIILRRLCGTGRRADRSSGRRDRAGGRRWRANRARCGSSRWADTLIVISLDSLRARQDAGAAEVGAVRRLLAHPDHLVFICHLRKGYILAHSWCRQCGYLC
jgi:hypothetical protein